MQNSLHLLGRLGAVGTSPLRTRNRACDSAAPFAMLYHTEPSAQMTENCAFCKRNVPTRGHHVVPRCKGGREIVPTCHSCENFIHQTWSHNELRDEFNT